MVFQNISIIGSGNLAFHLSKNLENMGVTIVNVYSRDIKKAKALTSKLYHSEPTDSLDFRLSSARFFFLCVSDDAIKEISSKLLLPQNAILIHCSGSVSLESIFDPRIDTGVFYPVQTFSKERKISFQNIPVCIEASTLKVEKILEHLAKGLKANPFFMNSDQRKVLHLSSVFACNFSNHLFSIAKHILQGQGLPFNLLHHLIAETVQKAIEHDPEQMQTGPAIRNDLITLALHESLLSQDPEWKLLYKLLSDDINKLHE